MTFGYIGSPAWDRTTDQQVNSLLLYRWATREYLVRGKGIEPLTTGWKPVILPLNEPRSELVPHDRIELP